MRSFQRADTLDPVPGDVVQLLRRIDLAAGAESSFLDQLPQLLESLRVHARIDSITASSAIEGVVVDEARVPRLTSGVAGRLRSRNEAEFAGYTVALDYLNQANPPTLDAGLVLHLHRLLFSLTEGRGGQFKSEDNVVVDRNADGSRVIRFVPVSAAETPFFVDELVARTLNAFRGGEHHPLIVTTASILDLLCIHPFADGNGRVARLLTTWMLAHTGYGVGRYVSVEQLIYDAKDDYYDSLGASTTGWFDDGQHDVWPWTRYLLGRVAAAYDLLRDRVSAGTFGGTKQDRIRDYVMLHAPSEFAIADIRRAVPGVSDNTIRLVLVALKEQGRISSSGTGRGATWHRG